MLGAQVGWFVHDSSAQGAHLVHQARKAIAAASHSACQARGRNAGRDRPAPGTRGTAPAEPQRRPAAGHRGGSVRGLLEAPSLGMVAPVRNGTSEAVLYGAVGHVPASAWPGRRGTSVFAAHNVTWFSHIDRLRAGDQIRYVTPCRTYIYKVTGHRITQAGYPVYNTGASRIVLDTCYPLNALYLTSSRYLVFARLAGIAATSAPPRPLPSTQLLAVPAPPELAAEGLALDQNYTPVGVLRVTGSPAPAWQQSSAPLAAEAAGLAAYFGAVRSAGQGRPAWWADLAPRVPVRRVRGIWGGEISGYDSHLDVILRARADRVLGITLTALVTTADSRRPGTYHLTVTETVAAGGRLLVTGFVMRPAGLAGRPAHSGGNARRQAAAFDYILPPPITQRD